MNTGNKCSVNHEEYKAGAEACIKHGYYVNHRIQCPECKEYLEPCKHENTHLGYGYAHSYQCKGIGAYVTCEDCGELLEYHMDKTEGSQEELDWYENSKWGKND